MTAPLFRRVTEQPDGDLYLGAVVRSHIDSRVWVVDMLFSDPAMLQALGVQYRAALGETVPLDLTDDGDRALAEAGGQTVLRWLVGVRDYVERDGIWMTLDRRQINTLIRHLRRARDEAYGRDE